MFKTSICVMSLSLFLSLSQTFGADCNLNGKADACDLSCAATGCSTVVNCGRSNDCNGNNIPDECDVFPTTTIRSLRVGDATEVTAMTAPAGDARLWIVEKAGRIRILSGGTILSTPYLDITSRVATDGERGLVGLTFSPNFSSNATFYIYYTNRSGNIIIAKLRASGSNPLANTADPTEVVLKSITTTSSFHNGGCLQFGFDGYLYGSIGDGGPNTNGQDPNTLFGKIIRLDVNSPPNYIPANNPFIGTAPLDEIWSLGWRNPWKFSFDAVTGNMFIADVGTSLREEINFEPANVGGRNYGWRCMEGTSCTGLSGCTCNAPNLTLPITEYTHASGSCAVIGGYVYRGCGIPSLQGTYFYGDLCGNYIKSFRYSPANGVTEHVNRTTELGQSTIQGMYSFGEDGFGELYYSGGAGIFKIIPGTTVNPICGNSILEVGEECDDGNVINGDGCSSVCDIEPVGPVCGNSILESGEECDDGNLTNGDGCDSICNIEPIINGACCINSTCVVETSNECLLDGGTYQGNNTACSLTLCSSNGPSCRDLRTLSPLKAQCSSNGTVTFMVVLNNTSYHGETATVSVNGMIFNPIFSRRLAIGTVCCLHGPVVISLLDPSGCIAPITINCP